MWSNPAAQRLLPEAKQQFSPAMKLIQHFHEHQGHQCRRSNERYRDGMRDVLRMVIRYGLEFHRDDFNGMQHSAPGEHEYAIACGCERGRSNMSAAQAYEEYVDRKPFMIADEGIATPTRIYVGRQFKWEGKNVTCTSFAKDNSHAVACTYKRDEQGFCTRHVERVLKISHADIRDEKKRAAIACELRTMVKGIPVKHLRRFQGKVTEHCGHCVPEQMTLDQLTWVRETLAASVVTA